jgi:hypothetical protein
MDRKSLPLASVIYPDVLGAITGGGRVGTEHIQYAVGIFPARIYINQPLELIVLFQSMINTKMQVKVEFKLPSSDRNGDKVVIEAPKTSHVTDLKPAEVGLLHIPMVVRAPTKAGPRFPIYVRITTNVPQGAKVVRHPDGGPPPSVVEVSPFRLQAFREVHFATKLSDDLVKLHFNVEASTLPPTKTPFDVRFESLWAQENLQEEQRLAQAKTQEAQQIALGGNNASAYDVIYQATVEKFNNSGFPLHPGEARAIAKMLTYTLEEAPALAAGHHLQQTHWFKRLRQVLASNESLSSTLSLGEIVVQYLYEALVYDAVILAFGMMRPRTREDLGDNEEQAAYASRVFRWLVGQGESDLTYIYLPLTMGGLLTDRLVHMEQQDNPWELVKMLREAMKMRQRNLKGEATTIFKMLDRLIMDIEDEIHQEGYRKI